MQKTVSRLLRSLVELAAGLTLTAIFSIILYILCTGIGHLRPELFAWRFTTGNLSMMPAILGTAKMTLLTLAIAVPFGLGGAIYLAEYARRGSRLVGLLRMATQTLSGIPSILFGLLGYLLFNLWFGWGYSLLSGAMTLAILILPLLLRTAEEALLAVSDSYRAGSFALGAGKLRTVLRVTLPAAAPGILAGLILAVGRIFGESAALIFTSGSGTSSRARTGTLFQSTATLSVYLYTLMNEGLHMEQAHAVAVVLLLLALLVNALSAFLAKRLIK